jgi:hypothetical protein
MAVVRVRSFADLLAISRAGGVPIGAHDADDDGVEFVFVDGRAGAHGFWPEHATGTPYGSILESHIIIRKDGEDIAAVNTAWLFHIALDAAVDEENKKTQS